MQQFPIHCTRPGPEFGSVVEGIFTHNPIKEGDQFEIQYKNFIITFELDMHFHTHPDTSMIIVKNVKQKQQPKRPTPKRPTSKGG